MNPECRDGKHNNCTGGWDEETDQPADRPCHCHAWSGMADTVKRILAIMKEQGLIEPGPPTGPRDRALWLREHRNTGPDKVLDRRKRTP